MLTLRNLPVLLSFLAILAAVLVIPAAYGQADCRQRLDADGTVSGQWTSDCQSKDYPSAYALYYEITLTQSADVTIILTSQDADTYLNLWRGDTVTGTPLHKNNDAISGDTTTSRIQETLAPGIYTIEATTSGAAETGVFSLTVFGLPSTATPVPTPGTSRPGTSSLASMIQRVRPSVVRISNNVNESRGTGAIIKVENGQAYVLTNEHVTTNDSQVTVRVNDALDIQGTVIGADPMRDLAIVQIPCSYCQPIQFADSSALHVGDPVVAIGYVFDYAQPRAHLSGLRPIVPGIATVTQGIISAFRYDSSRDFHLVQTDTPINPGNSGGPLLTTEGHILGVNTFSFQPSDGIHFAVLETTVQQHLPRLLSGQAPPQTREPLDTHYSIPLIAGPSSGHFHHNPASGRINLHPAAVQWSYNLAASARFRNPYDASEHLFDFGFILRSNSQSDIRFIVVSNHTWLIQLDTASGRRIVAQGNAPGLATAAYKTNYLTVVLSGNYASAWLNGERLMDDQGGRIFAIPSETSRGEAYIGNGFYTNTLRAGAITEYDYFRVRAVRGTGTDDDPALHQPPQHIDDQDRLGSQGPFTQ